MIQGDRLRVRAAAGIATCPRHQRRARSTSRSTMAIASSGSPVRRAICASEEVAIAAVSRDSARARRVPRKLLASVEGSVFELRSGPFPPQVPSGRDCDPSAARAGDDRREPHQGDPLRLSDCAHRGRADPFVRRVRNAAEERFSSCGFAICSCAIAQPDQHTRQVLTSDRRVASSDLAPLGLPQVIRGLELMRSRSPSMLHSQISETALGDASLGCGSALRRGPPTRARLSPRPCQLSPTAEIDG